MVLPSLGQSSLVGQQICHSQPHIEEEKILSTSMFHNFEDPNGHSIEVENQVDFKNGENVEIDEREVTEITLIKKFEEDNEEVKQEKNIEVSQELLMTELSSLDYYDGFKIAIE